MIVGVKVGVTVGVCVWVLIRDERVNVGLISPVKLIVGDMVASLSSRVLSSRSFQYTTRPAK